jgi:hypothetical protein
MEFSKTLFTLIIALCMINIISKEMCPKYTCDKGPNNSCAFVNGDFKFNSVKLTDICKQDKFCDISNHPWEELANTDRLTEYKCKDKTIRDTYTFRYPGEACEYDNDCVNAGGFFTGRCRGDKVCTGADEGFRCASHAECWKGLFCDKTYFCAKQLPFNSPCTSSSECENKYLCHLGVCNLKPYSLELGTQVDSQDQWTFAKCKYGFLDNKHRCSSLEQTSSSEGEFVKCKIGEKCSYIVTTGDDEVTKTCQCGYNSDGQGYCPKGHNSSKLFVKFRPTKMAKYLF